MRWQTIGWLFAGALTLHNAEEGLWLLPWAKRRGYWRIPVSIAQARIVLVLLTLLAYGCAWLSAIGNRAGIYLLCGVALTMLLNVLVPHLIASIALRTYSPGTGTAVALNLPMTCWLLHRAFVEQRITPHTFAWAGPAVVVGILALIPLLFLLLKAER
jgi:Protein of unknown function with HXXEE motif